VSRGVEFDVKNVVGNFPNLREMFALSGSRTVPVIVIGTEVVVGFDRAKIDRLLAQQP
jgi:glutaredoxin 3